MINLDKIEESGFGSATSLRSGGGIVRSRRYVALCGTVVLLFFTFIAFAHAADQSGQIVVNYADILKANPMPAGAKAQAIKVAEDDTATISIGRFPPGFELKPHFHKTHSETVYVIEGNGQMVIDGKTIEIKPGSINFTPVNNVHSVKNTGSVDIVILQVMTPASKAPDRVFVP
jgi:quercetin dioxygenase-like cupin family protein